MRLIDADELKNKLDTISPLYATDEYDYCTKDILDKVYDLIQKQPTAYDVDKVVKRLESILEGVNIQLELSKDFQPKESKSVKSDIVFFAEKKRLCEEFIKIVKSGGIV